MHVTLALLSFNFVLSGPPVITVTGEVLDARTGRTIPSRVDIQSDSGKPFFPQPASSEGSAVRYEKQNWINAKAVEHHTTLSAHAFRVELEPGGYTFTVERGKEYRALERKVVVGPEPVHLKLDLERWVDMGSRGWFSGDTHVHRDPAELPNVMLAEDVNVVFPMVYWTTEDVVPPSQSQRSFKGEYPARPVAVDATHVYYPRNTEYEIFTTAKKQHTLGAILIVGHKSIFDFPVLPLSRLAERARAEGALLDLEKHNWPWSMAIVPLLGVDLFELANNHHWRTEFSIKDWAVAAPRWMGLDGTGSGSERDWTLYGFMNYYALLDCGFRLRPAAGTANGVHPVPLGFGRVYVQLKDGFSFDAWMKGLNEGRSFVTTGPMLLAEVDGRPPGGRIEIEPGKPRTINVAGTILSETQLSEGSVEVVVNGEVAHRLTPKGARNAEGAFEASFAQAITLAGSSWIAVRAWENREGGRVRFAHTAPWFFDVPGAPLRPRKEEIAFLIERVKEEVARNKGVLPAEAIAELEKALSIYKGIARNAR